MNKILKKMKQKFNKMREKITGMEVILRILTILLVAILVYFSEKTEREIITVVGFAITFIISIYMHKHFLTITTLFYLVASSQELYSGVEKPPIIDTYWFIGNCFLIISIVTFAYRLIFKYKIIEHDDNKAK